MTSVCTFLVKFSSIISWVLSCFDRVIFKGHLPISRIYELEQFVDCRLKIRRKAFLDEVAPRWSQRLIEMFQPIWHKMARDYVTGSPSLKGMVLC
jgi:hypothetical protein